LANRDELVEESVAVASASPFTAHHHAVPRKGNLMPSPHPGRWMVRPSGLRWLMIANRNAECEQQLFSFDSLLAEPLSVKASCRMRERCVRKKRLHQNPSPKLFD
jgi:hypothetical protein